MTRYLSCLEQCNKSKVVSLLWSNELKTFTGHVQTYEFQMVSGLALKSLLLSVEKIQCLNCIQRTTRKLSTYAFMALRFNSGNRNFHLPKIYKSFGKTKASLTWYTVIKTVHILCKWAE